MSPSDRLGAFGRWLVGPRGLMVLAVIFLFLLMTWSFLVAPWGPPACGGAFCSVPITSENPANESASVTGSLFGGYAVLVLVSGLVLASCMIGGVYLAKMEGGPKP